MLSRCFSNHGNYSVIFSVSCSLRSVAVGKMLSVFILFADLGSPKVSALLLDYLAFPG